MSLPLPALLTQLRATYPAASLLSELLAIESNVFVVRASVQIGSVTLATGMAAAADIEAAEDRAKYRAIEALLLPATVPAPAIPAPAIPAPAIPASGVLVEPAVSPNLHNGNPTPPISPPAISPLTPLAKNVPSPTELEPQPDSSAPDALTDWDNPLQVARSTIPKESSLTNLDIDFDLNSLLQENTPALLGAPPEEPPVPAAADLFTAVTSDPSTPIDPPVDLADLNLTKLTLPKADSPDAGAEKPTRRKSTVATAEPTEPVSIAASVEVDRSGEIARIGVEMKRLGWDTKKGRDHLQKTYGKRSRQELNDDELMDFLRYLEAQPSSAQMPF